MKKDKFSEVNSEKKRGSKVIVIIAIIALCLAGTLYAVQLRNANGSVTLDMSSAELFQNESNMG